VRSATSIVRLETIRQERETLRATGEAARAAGEEASYLPMHRFPDEIAPSGRQKGL
jgi:hypothetical protein